MEDFPEGVIASRMVDGKVYGLPMEVEPMAIYYSSRPSRRPGLTRTTCPRPGTSCSTSRKKLTTAEPLRRALRDDARLLPELHLVSVHVAGRRRVPDARRQERIRFAGRRSQALKLWQDAINSGVAPRQVLGGGGWRHRRQPRGRATAPCRTSASGASRRWSNNAKTFHTASSSCRFPRAASMSTDRRRLGVRRQRQGQGPRDGRQVLAWALASMATDSIQRVVDWCTVAKIDMPPRNSALEQGAEAFNKGNLGIFAKEIYPGARGEPRLPPRGLQDHLGRHPGDPARRRRSCRQTATAASQQLDAFLATYQGADPMMPSIGADRIHGGRSNRFMRVAPGLANGKPSPPRRGSPATSSSCRMRWGSCSSSACR